ncbi:MAG: branched-chain amino acid ABC transporter permease [Acidimicrobiales bacterium]
MGETLVFGLVAGGIYGLFAVGIVLVYRGSGVINFAQGEIGTFSLFLAWYLITDRGHPWLLGAAAAVLLAAAIGWGFERVVVRPMIDASKVAVAVATVGLLGFLLALELRLFTASPRGIGGPIQGLGVRVAGVYVSPTQMLSLVVTLAVGLSLAALLKRTDFGLGVLAAAEDPIAVRLVGVPLSRVSGFIWSAGAAVAALAALLIEPTVGVFVPGFASELFLRGLAAAVVGGLKSLPGAFLGGLVVGIIEAGSGKWFGGLNLPGVQVLSVFVLILLVLLFRPQGVLSRQLRGVPA